MLSTYHGNWAVFVFLMALPLAFYLVATRPPQKAAIQLAFIVTMWWPVSIWLKLPSVPQIEKDTWPYVCILLALLVLKPQKIFKAKPGFGPEFLQLVGLLACVGTWKTNTDPLTYGSWVSINMPGLDFNDAMSMGMDQLLKIGVPFFLGRALFKTIEDAEMAVKFLILSALIYIIPIAAELRLSPQVHTWIYGYPASRSFLQMLRWGGYRPLVCTTHGLALGILYCQITMLGFVFMRLKIKTVKQLTAKATAWTLLVVLILCKSTGAILFAVATAPLIAKGKLKTQMRVAVILAGLSLGYPVLKSQGWIPTDAIVDAISSINRDRALSVAFRFDNEKLLADKAQERYLFGWGSYGRNSIYHPVIGKEMTIADGYWIILIGIRGFAGFMLAFGMGLAPVFLLSKRIRRLPDQRSQHLLVGLALIVAIGFFDLIPNGLFSNYTYFLSGILWGVTQNVTKRGKGGKKRSSVSARDGAVNPR